MGEYQTRIIRTVEKAIEKVVPSLKCTVNKLLTTYPIIPIIKVVGGSGTTCNGSNFILAVTNYSFNTYQWQQFIDGAWVNIDGATLAKYNTGALNLNNAESFACVQACQLEVTDCYSFCGDEICSNNCTAAFEECFAECPETELTKVFPFRVLVDSGTSCAATSDTLYITITQWESSIICPTPLDCSTLNECGCGEDFCPPGVPGLLLPTIHIETCQGCNLDMSGLGWIPLVQTPANATVGSYIFYGNVECGGTPEEYLECWEGIVGNYPIVEDCYQNTCVVPCEECYNLCDPEDNECLSACETDICTPCYNSCVELIPFIPQACSQFNYYAIATLGEYGEEVACGTGGLFVQEIPVTIQDSFGSSTSCTMYRYGINC